MLIHNNLKRYFFQYINLPFSAKNLLSIFFVTFTIFTYTSPLYCAGINTINKSLNKNEISTIVVEPIIPDSNEVKVLTPSKQIPKIFKNLSAAVKNIKIVIPPHGLYKFETIKINKNSFAIKKSVPIKPSKIKFLPKSSNNKTSKPLRIGVVQAPVRIADNPDISDPTNAIPMQLVLKEFPSDSSFPEKMSAEELAAVSLLKQMHKAITDGDSENNVLSMYIKITQNYSSYQYLTALARFYFEECRLMRSNGYVYTGTAYYEAYSQLAAMYSDETTSKNAIYPFILQKCEERKKQIEDNNSQIEKENKYIKWSLDPYFLNEAIRQIEAKEYTENPYYSNVPTEKTFWAQYNVYLENYRKLIKNYLLTRNFNEASKAMADYENFYTNNIKRFHTVKYYKDNGTLLTKQIEIFRDAEEHLNFIRQYVAQVSYQAEVNQNNDLFKSEIEKYVKVMETYQKSTGSETTSSEKISDEKLELYKSHASSSSINEQNNYYRNNLNITFTIFTRSEGLYKYSDEIPDPRDALKLWHVTDGTAPLHAFKTQIKVKSLISRREKSSILEFKSDSLAPYYCTKFIPNESNNSSNSTLCIINDSTDETGIANSVNFIDGGFELLQDPSTRVTNDINPIKIISTLNTFKDFINGISVYKKVNEKANDAEIISKAVVESMGYEKIAFIDPNNTVVTSVPIKNQAKWFIYTGHGKCLNGILKTYWKKNITDAKVYYPVSDISSSPEPYAQTYQVVPINKNVHYAVFACCETLRTFDILSTDFVFDKNNSGIAWRRIFGEKTALLGYSNAIDAEGIFISLTQLLNHFENESLKYEKRDKLMIIQKWLHLNEELIIQQINKGDDYRAALFKSGTSASAILGNYYFYLYPDLKRYKLIGKRKKMTIFTKHAIGIKNIEKYL